MPTDCVGDRLAHLQDSLTEQVRDNEQGKEDETDSGDQIMDVCQEAFRFFDLPYEIRRKIYNRVLFQKGPPHGRAGGGGSGGVAIRYRSSGNVGSSSRNKALAPLSHRLSLFLASRHLHDEATSLFYSAQVFRVFPIQDYSRLPTLSSLAPTYRPLITAIELILGSSWTKPPKNWQVNDLLGLRQMASLYTLKVFIQCDPSHPLFEGFRISAGFYTSYAADLLRRILDQLPDLVQVEFDAWPCVQKRGPLMTALLAEAKAAKKKILWGPERCWSNVDNDDDHDHDITTTQGEDESCQSAVHLINVTAATNIQPPFLA